MTLVAILTARKSAVVTFPSQAAFAAYRGDQRLRALARLRAEAVVHTELLVGEDGPRYNAD